METENKIGQQIFDKLRSKFENVTLGDEEAQATQNPEEAAFFNFDYTVKNEHYGNVTVSAIDDAIKIYYSKNISDKLVGEELRSWYSFLQDIRKLAMSNMLTFDVHDINKDRLSVNDIQSTASRQADMTEGKMYGSTRSSYQKQGPTRIIVRHNDKINDEVRGARSRKIESVFVETCDGERFKMPFNSLPGTRAMAKHIGEGGRPYDLIGESIATMVSEIAALRPFIAHSRNKIFEDPTTSAMVEAAKEYYAETRKTLSRIKGKRGYKAYTENFVEATEISEYDGDDMKGRFTNKRFNDRMEAAMPVVHKAYNLKEQPVMEHSGDRYDDMEWGDADDFEIQHDDENPFNRHEENMRRNADVNDLMRGGNVEGDQFEDWAEGVVEAGYDAEGESKFNATWGDPGVDADYGHEDKLNVEKMPSGPGGYQRYLQKHMELSDDEMSVIGGIVTGQLELDDYPKLYEKLYTYYSGSGEMPYGTQKARDGDPHQWIGDQLEKDFDLDESLEEGTFAWPSTPVEWEEASQILKEPIPFGVDGMDAINIIFPIFGDELLSDIIYDEARNQGPEADARPTIQKYLQDIEDQDEDTEFMDEDITVTEDKATYSDYKSAYSSSDVSGTDSDGDIDAMVSHLEKKGKKVDRKAAKAAHKRMSEANQKQDGLQLKESIQRLAGIIK